jgi:nucleotide-binding universal stress UspA family protein
VRFRELREMADPGHLESLKAASLRRNRECNKALKINRIRIRHTAYSRLDNKMPITNRGRPAMHAFSHVLYPVDFSPRCEATIPFVKEMVRRCRAKLTLLHVVEIPVDWYAAVTPSLHMPWDEFEAQYKLGRECLGGFACRYFADISREGPMETICERGEPGRAIVAQAENIGCDLVMIPTHGKGPFRSLFLRSVTARVLHHSECAIWTDAHIETGLSGQYLNIRKILCAVERGETAAGLTREAMSVAQEYGAEVELVHAVSDAAPKISRPF